MKTIKLVTCSTCGGRRTVPVTINTPNGRQQLNVPCTPCGASGKVVKF